MAVPDAPGAAEHLADVRRQTRLYAASILGAQEQAAIAEHLGVDTFSPDADEAVAEFRRIELRLRRGARRV